MDRIVLNWFNNWVGHTELIDSGLSIVQTPMLKTIPFMLVFWSLWFFPKTFEAKRRVREALLSSLLSTIPVIAVLRAAANYLPFSARPIHTPDIKINFHSDLNTAVLDGWSSMPSDHAGLFVGFSVAIFTIHRGFGLFLLSWSFLIVSLPRIILGLHWPSDIIVGALIGSFLTIALITPITRLIRRTQIIPFFETREALGYPLLFAATFEMATLFSFTRYLVKYLTE